MCNDNGYKEVYSITQFARILGVSRTTLYEYKKAGILPPPLSCPDMNKRPFYTDELLQRCMTILRTGIGYNGRVILFNTKQKCTTQSDLVMPKKTRADLYQSLTTIMHQIGIKVAIDDVKEAVNTVRSKGVVITNEPTKELIEAVYGYFRPDDKNIVRKV